MNRRGWSKFGTYAAAGCLLFALFLVVRFLYYGGRLGYLDSAISSIRVISEHEKIFSSSHAEIGFTCNFSKLITHSAPEWENRLIARLAETGERNGYLFELRGCSQAKPNVTYAVAARPLHRNMVALCANETGILKYDSEGSVANCLKNGSAYQ